MNIVVPSHTYDMNARRKPCGARLPFAHSSKRWTQYFGIFRSTYFINERRWLLVPHSSVLSFYQREPGHTVCSVVQCVVRTRPRPHTHTRHCGIINIWGIVNVYSFHFVFETICIKDTWIYIVYIIRATTDFLHTRNGYVQRTYPKKPIRHTHTPTHTSHTKRRERRVIPRGDYIYTFVSLLHMEYGEQKLYCTDPLRTIEKIRKVKQNKASDGARSAYIALHSAEMVRMWAR